MISKLRVTARSLITFFIVGLFQFFGLSLPRSEDILRPGSCQLLIMFVLSFVSGNALPTDDQLQSHLIFPRASCLYSREYSVVPDWLAFYKRNFLPSYTRQDGCFGGSVPAQRPIEWTKLWRSRTWGIILAYLDMCLTRRTSCGFRAPRSPQVKKSNSVHSIHPCKMSSDERKSRNKPTSTQKTIKKSCWAHQEKSYDLMDSRSIKKKKPRICQSNLIGYCVVRA